MRAQKERLRGPPPGCGAFKLDPVSLLYFARPAAVRPPLRDLCLPILRLTDLLFFAAIFHTLFRWATDFWTVGSFTLWHDQEGFVTDMLSVVSVFLAGAFLAGAFFGSTGR
jgi:hypothetical protein